MRKYQKKPSIQLQEEYKKAYINTISISDFETFHEEIGISEILFSDIVKK